MKNSECEKVRDLLPEWIVGGLGAEDRVVVDGHLPSCGDCAGEERLLRALLALKPTPPPDLEERIKTRVREEILEAGQFQSERDRGNVISLRPHRRWAPAWVLSAAAVLVLSLGIGVIWNGDEIPEVGQDPIQVVADEPIPEAWLWDDGMVAGAPVYDGLTDEQLEALIQELEG